MADLSDIQSAQSIKLTDETDLAAITPNGELKVIDGLREGGVYGALSIPTADTPVEAKVGVSRLSGRKFLQITCTTPGLYWGTDNSVTTLTGTPLANNQVITFEIDPESAFEVWLVSASASRTARIVEMP